MRCSTPVWEGVPLTARFLEKQTLRCAQDDMSFRAERGICFWLRPCRAVKESRLRCLLCAPSQRGLARKALALLTMAWVGVSLSWAVTPEECLAMRKHGHRAEAQKCFESLILNRDPYLRAEGYWGLERYQEANNEFRAAVAGADKNASYRVRWGLLMHERFNNVEAENLFKEALERDEKNAQACLGLALVSADGFDSKAVEWTAKALKLDPHLVEAHELAANLALEDSNPEQAVREADEALKLSPEALDAMAVHAAVEVLADRSPAPWLEKIRQVNPSYGEGCALIAHHLELN